MSKFCSSLKHLSSALHLCLTVCLLISLVKSYIPKNNWAEISEPGKYLREESQSLFNGIGSRKAMQSFAENFSNPLKWEVDDGMALVILHLPLMYTVLKYLREIIIRNRKYTINKVNELKEQAKELKASRFHILKCMSTVKAFVKLIAKRKFGILSCKVRRRYRIKRTVRKWSRLARLRYDRQLVRSMSKSSSKCVVQTKENLNNTSGYVSDNCQCDPVTLGLNCSANTREIAFSTSGSEDADCPPLQMKRVNSTEFESAIPPRKVLLRKSKSCSDLNECSLHKEFDRPKLSLSIQQGDRIPIEHRQSTPKKLKDGVPVFELPISDSTLNLSVAVDTQGPSITTYDLVIGVEEKFLFPFADCSIPTEKEDGKVPEMPSITGEELPGTAEDLVSLNSIEDEDVVVEVHYQNPDYKNLFKQKLPDSAYIDPNSQKDSSGDETVSSLFPTDADYSDTSFSSNGSPISKGANCSPISSIDSAEVNGKILRPGAGFMKAPISIEDKSVTNMHSPLASPAYGNQDSVHSDKKLELIGSSDIQQSSTKIQRPGAAMFQGMDSISPVYSESSSGTSFVPSDVWSPRYSSSESSVEERTEDKPELLQTVKSLAPSASPIARNSKNAPNSNSTARSFGFRRWFIKEKKSEAIMNSNRDLKTSRVIRKHTINSQCSEVSVEDVCNSENVATTSSENDSIEIIKDSINESTSDGTKPDVKTIIIVSDNGSSFGQGFEVAHRSQDIVKDNSSNGSFGPVSKSSSSSCGLHFTVGEIMTNENSLTTLNIVQSGNKIPSTSELVIPQNSAKKDRVQQNKTEKVATTTSLSANEIPALARACNQMTVEQLHRQLVSMDEKEQILLQGEIEEIRKKAMNDLTSERDLLMAKIKAKEKEVKRSVKAKFLQCFRSRRNTLRCLQDRLVEIEDATDVVKQRADVWQKALDLSEQQRQAEQRHYQYVMEERLQKFKVSILRCVCKAMDLRKTFEDMEYPTRPKFKNEPRCYDCCVGRHPVEPDREPKRRSRYYDDDIPRKPLPILCQEAGFLPSCPIVRNINARYDALKLSQYVPISEKVGRIADMQRLLQWELFNKSYLYYSQLS